MMNFTKSTILTLAEGYKVNLSINPDVFTSDKTLQETVGRFQDDSGDTINLLSLDWPDMSKNRCFLSHWTPTIDSPMSVERKQEFMEISLKEIGSNNWEMLKAVVSRCLRDFNARLLEVTFWGYTFGHDDIRSAQDAKCKERDMCKILSCLLADTDYTFCDIKITWSVSVMPSPHMPVQESSMDIQQQLMPYSFSETSIAVDCLGSMEVSLTQGDNPNHHAVEDVNSTDAKQLLLLKDIQEKIYSLNELLKGIDSKVGRYQEYFDRLMPGGDLYVLSGGQSVGALTKREDYSTLTLDEPPSLNRGNGGRSTATGQITGHRSESSLDLRQTGVRLQINEHGKSGSSSKAAVTGRTSGTGQPDTSVNNGHSVNDSGNVVGSDRRLQYLNQGQSAQHQSVHQGRSNSKSPHPANAQSSSPMSASTLRAHDQGLQTPSRSSHQSPAAATPVSSKPTQPPSHAGHLRSRDSPDQSSMLNTASATRRENEQQPRQPVSSSKLRSDDEGGAKYRPGGAGAESGRGAGRLVNGDHNLSNSHRESQSSTHRPNQPAKFTSQARQTSPAQASHSQTNLPRSVDPDRTKSVSQEKMKIEFESEDEAKLIKESVDRAYLEDKVKAPKAKSFDTILCLDISESMKDGGAFQAMKDAALNFVNGVEDVVIKSGVEENIGLVTFGGRANVVQNLTNDLSLIRDKIEQLKAGGKSPFVEALLVSMAAFVRKGGIVSVSGEWEVKPRIIFISDGLPTESTEAEGRDMPNNISNVRMSLFRMLLSFKTSDSFSNVHPIVFVPVGERGDNKYMKVMSEVCEGVYVEPGNITSLCQYFRVQETIGKVLVCLKRESNKLDQEKIEATIEALICSEMDKVEKDQVVKVVKQELNNPSRVHMQRPRPNDLENVFEATDKVNSGERLPLGTRVTRGPDWEWGDQDHNGPGTVISHDKKHSIHWVKWDKGDYNCYPYSEHRGYHIFVTAEHPRLKAPDEDLEIGMSVKKGPNWNAEKAEPGCGEDKGVVVRESRKRSKVVVRWPGGLFQTYQWSIDGVKEVDYCAPGERIGVQHDDHNQCQQQDRHSPTQTPSPSPSEYDGPKRWQWQGVDGTWHFYEPEVNKIIEDSVQKKRQSCLIERDGKSRRIMFKRLVEKVIDEAQSECQIQFVPVKLTS